MPRQMSTTKPSAPFRVAVLVETSAGPGRDMLQGIARWVRESGPWAIHLDPREQMFTPGWSPTWLKSWKGDGVIARLETAAMLEAVGALGLPVVDVLGETGQRGFPIVHVDDALIARAAADHLLERGFRTFGFVGIRNAGWSDRRARAFAEAVRGRECSCSQLLAQSHRSGGEWWDAFIEEAIEWLRSVEKPLGLMLASDHLGPPVTQACRLAGVPVPEDVAIVGVNNDEPLCQICDPPLSSVDANHEEVGYRAAGLLHRLMSREQGVASKLLLGPRRVVARQSSDISAVADPVVALALSMIREQACSGLQVGDIATYVNVSRSVLQRRFRAVMGRSVHEEIIRVQIHKAQELLRHSQLSLRSIAEKAGFKHQEYMGAVFKTRLGVTPGEFRKSSQEHARSR